MRKSGGKKRLAGDLLLGRGLGASSAFLSRELPSYQGATVVHNDYVRVLCDLGLIGTALFAMAYLSMFVSLWRRGTRTNSYRIIAMTCLLTYLIIAVTDNPLEYYLTCGQYVFLFVGISLTMGRHPGSENAGS